MKKNYLLLPILCILGWLWAAGGAASAKSTDGEPEPVKTAYGFLISDRKNPVGLYSFPVNDATKLTLIKETPKVSAGAWAKNTYYGATYDSGTALNWCKFDLKTGNMTVLAQLSGKMYSDMSYDNSTGKMYAISHPTATTTELVTVNLADGTRQKVLDMDLVLMTLACSLEGELYSLDLKGLLYRIEPKNGTKVTMIGDLFFDLSYIQSMEFDHETGKIYWAASNSYNAALYRIDVDQVTKTRLCSVGNSGELSGVYIPYSIAEPGAPAAVRELSVMPVSGNNKIRAEWTFPTETASGEVLRSMTNLSIECDEELLKTYVNGTDFTFVAGGKKSVEVEAPAGLHKFKVYVANEAGAGIAASAKVFVGQDVPAAPENLQMTVEGSTVVLSWNAVSNGLEGGEIDQSTLAYTVTRYPDETVLLANGNVLTLTDEVTKLDVYSYEVTASTAKGKGGSARSEWKAAGQACQLPYAFGFDNDTKFKLWTVVDRNQDGSTWKCSKIDGQPTAVYQYNSKNNGDDWLISPPLKLEGGKPYKVRFSYGAQNPTYPERMKITLGKDKIPEAQTIVLGSYEVDQYGLNPAILYLPEQLEAGTWYVGFQACSDKDMSKLYLSKVEILESVASVLSGTVTCGEAPLTGATVTLSNSDKTFTTDSEGKYRIPEINPGTYTLGVSKFGYEDFSKELAFGLLDENTEEVELTPVVQVKVSGTVKAQTGENLPGAVVSLHGYDNYTVVTDQNGAYSFEQVYCKGEYTLDVYALNYELVSRKQPEMTGDVTIGEIVLKEKLLSPRGLTTEATPEKVRLSWEKPEDRIVQYRYDDGLPPLYVLNMELDATPNTVSGTIYDTPTVFTAMSWQVANNNNPKTTVDIIILDLDENGKPTKKILFEQKGVPSQDSHWSSYQFPYPVIAPRGALIALRGDAFLCMDFGESVEWPFREKKSCMNFDYLQNEFSYLEDTGLRYNLLVRAEGIALGASRTEASQKAAPVPLPKYLVWRTAEKDVADVTKWTCLTPEPVGTVTFTDESWKEVPKGTYKYVVKALYSDGATSAPVYSGMIPRLLTAEICLWLTTNIGESAAGAVIVLVNEDQTHRYKVTAGDDGKATFADVWEGNYLLAIDKPGYELLEERFAVEGSKNLSKEYRLSEYAPAPFNLKIGTNGTAGSRLFRWNVADKWADDFEGHDNFAVNSAGATGWSYIDGDGDETTASGFFDFPHRYDRMAFIVFNPSATTPAMSEKMQPHSGDKLLCCFAGMSKPNNDYLISPELEMENDFVVRFWAASYDKRFPEEIRVGYSVTGKAQQDFTWVLAKQKVPAVWTEYIVNIPKEAKFVTVNCVSDNGVILMLDDIYIGVRMDDPAKISTRIPGRPISYELYLDGTKLASAAGTSYTLTGLSQGDHVAGVKAVYASGTTSVSTFRFKVEENVGAVENATRGAAVSLYPLPVSEVLHINGEFDQARLLDVAGQEILSTGYTSVIEVNQYPAGIYYLVVMKEGKSSVFKVIIK